MHVVPSTKSKFITFTVNTWQRFSIFAIKWMKYPSREQEVVTDRRYDADGQDRLGLTLGPHDINILQPESENSSLGYHRR